MRIFAFHLLNDYSGSPKVLGQLLKGWAKNGISVTMVTCSGRVGFLSDIEGVTYRYFWYKWSANPLIRLVNYFLSQLILLFKLLLVVRKNDIIYINTVLPFGAAILGKLKSCRVVYHIHETSIKPAILKKFLFGLAKWTADDVIYVSQYLAQQESMNKQNISVIPNALEDAFIAKANTFKKAPSLDKNILMICSLKAYKGVFEFIKLAKELNTYHFRLVVNATEIEIGHFFKNTEALPSNLLVLPTQKDVHPQYQWADVVLNLSRPDQWVETFGLTAIEAKAYKLPVIVPELGGIAEIVEEGVDGYKANGCNTDYIATLLRNLLEQPETYKKISTNAGINAQKYNEAAFLKANIKILNTQNQDN